MLFRQDVLRRIAEGEVTLAFRRWRRPTVKAGGTLRTRVGVLAIDSVEPVDEDQVTDADARRAGAADREALLAGLRAEGTLTGSSSGSRGPTRASRCESAATSHPRSGPRSTRASPGSTPRAGTGRGPRPCSS